MNARRVILLRTVLLRIFQAVANARVRGEATFSGWGRPTPTICDEALIHNKILPCKTPLKKSYDLAAWQSSIRSSGPLSNIPHIQAEACPFRQSG
jgi:hypothetical protein